MLNLPLTFQVHSTLVSSLQTSTSLSNQAQINKLLPILAFKMSSKDNSNSGGASSSYTPYEVNNQGTNSSVRLPIYERTPGSLP